MARTAPWLLAIPAVVAACGPSTELVAEKDALSARVQQLELDNKRLDQESGAQQAENRRLQAKLADSQRKLTRAMLGLPVQGTLVANLDTSMGGIRCELWPDRAPETVLNFVGLAEGTKTWLDPRTHAESHKPFYDGLTFHRVIPKFMIQTGDPLATGAGGPGYNFADEITPTTRFDTPGLLAMANAGPDTNGSQFFITDRATPHNLDGKHTIFGQCDHQDVVAKIAEVDRNAQDKPLRDVVLRHVTIQRVPATAE